MLVWLDLEMTGLNPARHAIVEIQPEGKRAMGVRDFLQGHRLATGEVFSEA